MPPTKKQLAQLMAENPDLSDDQLVALAQAQEGAADDGILSTAKRWYGAASKPIFGKDSYTGMAIPETGYKAIDVPASILQAMTSPLDVATLSLGLGGGLAALKGAGALSKGMRAAEAASMLPHAVAGGAKAYAAEDPYEKAAGLVQMGLGAGGAAGIASTIPRMAGRGVASVSGRRAVDVEDLLRQSPAQMKAHGESGGSTFGRTGNAVGQDLYAVGGVVPSRVVPEAQFNEDILREFISKNSDALGNPTRGVGTWTKDGQVHLDISDLLPQSQADDLMRRRGEQAMFGLKKFDEVANPTAGQKATYSASRGWKNPGVLGIASPMAGMGVQEMARNPETGEVPEWAKVAALLGNVGGAAGLGMAAMRKTVPRPVEAAKREVASKLFMKKGDLTGVEGPALEALAGKEKDLAVQGGAKVFQKLQRGADPQLFLPERQKQLIEVGLGAEKQNWYRDWDQWARQNLHPEDRKLVADLLALTSTQTTPYDNVNRAMNALYRIKAGQSPTQVGQGLGLARKSVERYLTEGAIPGRKHYSFSQNLQGNFTPVTADSQAGRGFGLLPWEENALVKQKSGAHSVQRGTFIGPEQRAAILVKPKQGRGGLTSNEYNMVEDVIQLLAPEYGLDPAQTQAAHWFGSLQDVVTPRLTGAGRTGGGRNIPAYQRDPYNLQLGRRFERAGITPGEPLTLDKLAWLVKVIEESKGKGLKFK
jgi:hypothetical protein